MTKCIGCGADLQNVNKNEMGYTNSLGKNLCERCFRIRNYNEYLRFNGDNHDYYKVLDYIAKTKSLVILLIDLFNIPSDINLLLSKLNNDVVLVLNKRDILPLSLKDEKLLAYFDNYKFKDKIIVSAKKNYNLDLLMDTIKKYKRNEFVYIVGMTNAGKSTLINKILYNYTDIDSSITTSSLPSTTLGMISIKIDEDLTIVDTPGILDNSDFLNKIDSKKLKRIIPNREIHTITYQINAPTTIIVDEFLNVYTNDKVAFTLYISNMLKIDRKYNIVEEKKYKYEIHAKHGDDVVLDNIGFMTVTDSCILSINSDYELNIYTRNSII